MTGALPPIPSCPVEQAYLDRAYAHLARMRSRTKQATEIADNAAQEVDSAIAKAHLNARLRSLDTEVDGLALRPPRRRGRRHLVRRPAPRRGRGRRPGGRRLAGPRLHALLPRHRRRPARAPAAAAGSS